MKNKKGFTLIELLASITLIILLFVIIVPMSLNLIEKSNKNQCEKMANTIEANAELCVLDKNSICIDDSDDPYYVTLSDLYNNGYIEEKYENKFREEELNVDNLFGNYKIKITKKKFVDEIEDKNYLIYELVDKDKSNPCSN